MRLDFCSSCDPVEVLTLVKSALEVVRDSFNGDEAMPSQVQTLSNVLTVAVSADFDNPNYALRVVSALSDVRERERGAVNFQVLTMKTSFVTILPLLNVACG